MPVGVVPEIKSKMNVLVTRHWGSVRIYYKGHPFLRLGPATWACDLGNTFQEAKKLPDGLHVEESHQTGEWRFHVQ
jgi:hypothetical protein